MMIEISAREYKSPQELLDAHKERRARLFPQPERRPFGTPVRTPLLVVAKCEQKLKVDPCEQHEQADSHVLRYLAFKKMARGTRMRAIMAATAGHFDITMDDMTSPRRTRNISRPRQIAMYLVVTELRRSFPEIGRAFGGKDHTTVLHAARSTAARRASDPDLAASIDTIVAELRFAGIIRSEQAAE